MNRGERAAFRLRGALRLAVGDIPTAGLYTVHRARRATAGLRGRPSGPLDVEALGRWARMVARLLRIQVTVVGTPPRPPFLLVANHLGYVDALVLAACAPGTFVARADVARWPVIGALCRSVGTLFVDRSRRRAIPPVLDGIRTSLARRVGVILFPEATSSEGATVLPFRSSLLEVAARDGIPVMHATLTYRTPPGSPPARLAVCWWGDMTFGSHLLRLAGLPGFQARITFGPVPIQEPDRKILARRLWREVHARFEPVTG